MVTLADPLSSKLEIAKHARHRESRRASISWLGLLRRRLRGRRRCRALDQALDLVEKTGALVQVGVHDEHYRGTFNPFKIYEREVRIIGSNSCADKFTAAVDIMSDIHHKAAVLLGEPIAVWRFDDAVQSMVAGNAVKTQLGFDLSEPPEDLARS